MTLSRPDRANAVNSGDRVALAFEILELVAQHRTGISANDLAAALGVGRSTIYRAVNPLVQQEFLLRRPDLTGFILGVRVVELAQRVSTIAPTPEGLVVSRLREETDAVIHLARFADDQIELIDDDLRHPVSDSTALVAEPIRSAIGQVLLADLPPLRAERIARVPRDEVIELAEAAALRGYAQQVGLLSPDRACLAVAVRAEGCLVGALALSAEPSRISAAARHVHRLRDAANELGELWARTDAAV